MPSPCIKLHLMLAKTPMLSVKSESAYVKKLKMHVLLTSLNAKLHKLLLKHNSQQKKKKVKVVMNDASALKPIDIMNIIIKSNHTYPFFLCY